MKSIRVKLVLISSLLLLCAITVVQLALMPIKQESETFTDNILDRKITLIKSRHIKEQLWQIRNSLQNALLFPDNFIYKSKFEKTIISALEESKVMAESQWIVQTGNQHRITAFVNQLQRLKEAAQGFIQKAKTDQLQTSVDEFEKDIIPLFDSIWNTLNTVETEIQAQSNHDVSRVKNFYASVFEFGYYVLSTLILIIVGFYVFTRKTTLNPIRSLTAYLNGTLDEAELAQLQNKSGAEFQHLLSVFVRYQEELKEKSHELEYRHLHDNLTGLPNRLLLSDRVNQLIKDAQRNKITPGILLVDIEQFKDVNDALGFQIGDELLKQFGRRIQNLLRKQDTVARVGSDEFAILLHNVDKEGAQVVSKKIIAALEQPFMIQNHQLRIGVCQGMAIYPEHANTAADLLRNVTVAMVNSKRNHTPLVFYDHGLDQHNTPHFSISSDIREAINNNSLELFYQPKLDLHKNRVIGVEALLRWYHREKGFISPEIIVRSAEESGLIQPLSEWVLSTAMNQISEWKNSGIDIGVAVNLSAYNLQNPHLISMMQYQLELNHLTPQQLTLEITESAMMSNPQLATEMLSKIKEMGMRVAIDDFGTGYSSLGYLKSLPADELKIDRSFVMNITKDPNDLAIVQAVIDLSHNLGLKVVAEGIEDQQSMDLLHNLHCDMIQGYYISRPLPSKDFEQWYINFNLSPARQKSA